MPSEPEVYGAGLLSSAQKIRLLIEWAPLLTLMERVSSADTNQAKALAGVALLRWLATKTQTATDDAALDRFEAFLKTPDGEKVVELVVSLLGALKK